MDTSTSNEKAHKQSKPKTAVELLAAAKAYRAEAAKLVRAERLPELKKKQSERLAKKRENNKSHTFWISNDESVLLNAIISESPAKTISDFMKLVLESGVLTTAKLRKPVQNHTAQISTDRVEVKTESKGFFNSVLGGKS